jgi:hypothetical protein
MILESYLQELNYENSIQEKIIEFFKKNPKPKDDKIHKFAESEGIDPHKFEEMVYELLGSFLGEGKSKNFKGDYDHKQLEMGIKVEMEHTNNSLISLKITKDHLSEFSDYYTRLAKMEMDAENDN